MNRICLYLFMVKTETVSHIRIPLKLAEETQASVEAHLGVRVSTSAAVEWALKNHFSTLNSIDSPAKDQSQ